MKKPSIVMTPEVEEAIRNTPGAEITNKGYIKLLVSRYQKPEQAGSISVRTGVFFLPEVKSPYGKHYRSGQNKGPNASYGGSQYITGQITLHKPYIVKAGTGGLGPERAYINLMGKSKHEQMVKDIFSMVVNRGGYFSTPHHNVLEEWVEELLSKYKCGESDYDRYDTVYNIVKHSNQGNRMRYTLQEHIIAHTLRRKGYDSVLSYSKSGGLPRLSEVFDLRMMEYPESSGFVVEMITSYKAFESVNGSFNI